MELPGTKLVDPSCEVRLGGAGDTGMGEAALEGVDAELTISGPWRRYTWPGFMC